MSVQIRRSLAGIALAVMLGALPAQAEGPRILAFGDSLTAGSP